MLSSSWAPFWRWSCSTSKSSTLSPPPSPAPSGSPLQLWFKVLVAVLPIGVIGLLVDDWVTEHFYTPTVVAAALIIYGVLFIAAGKTKQTGQAAHPFL